ncbi:MAG: hypothetical protein ACK45R_09640 [Candidatus Kapaibacterium sp.]|jgi:hypothetical protein
MLRVKSIVVCLFVIAIVAAAPALRAQDERGGEGSRDFTERVQRMKLNKLVEVLRLDDAKELEFRKVYTEQQRKVEDARAKLDASTKKLQDVLRDEGSSSQISAATDETTRGVSALVRTQEQRAQAVRPLLSAEQYAKFVLFELRFQEIARRIMKRQRENRP